MRHLTERQASSALRRGRQIDQFLGREQLPDRRWTLRWLTVFSTNREFVLSQHHVEDVGDGQMADIGTFPPIDPDEYLGEGTDIATAESADKILAMALEHGATPDRWVNAGVLADEYLDSRSAG